MKKNLTNPTFRPMLFLEGEIDRGGGGGGWNTDPDDTGDVVEQNDALERPMPGTDPATTTRPGASTSTPAAPTLDPDAFAKSFGQVIGQTLQQHQQQQQAQLPPTPEQLAEARRQLNFFDINDDYIKRFGNIETQKQALEEFRDGVVKHILTVFSHLRNEDRQQIDQRFTPLQQMIEERNNTERMSRFQGRFPQFAAPELGPYVETAIEQLAARDAFKGKSEAEAFKLLAEHLAAAAKVTNNAFVLEDRGNAGAPQPSRSNNSIPVTSGGSGASRSNGAAPAKKGWALAHMR